VRSKVAGNGRARRATESSETTVKSRLRNTSIQVEKRRVASICKPFSRLLFAEMKVTSSLLHTLVDRAACLAGNLDNRIASCADMFTDSTGQRSNKDARGTQAIADRLAARRKAAACDYSHDKRLDVKPDPLVPEVAASESVERISTASFA
jgi:hypothetical protein